MISQDIASPVRWSIQSTFCRKIDLQVIAGLDCDPDALWHFRPGNIDELDHRIYHTKNRLVA
jgi:hypothetical protein